VEITFGDGSLIVYKYSLNTERFQCAMHFNAYLVYPI